MSEGERTGDGRSIWTRPERSARGPAPEHTRTEIASAGVALADARGLAAVTMRSVAAAVGTGPASLYRYVATRDELVELMADQVRGEFAYEDIGAGDPAAGLLAIARQGRAIYLRHPWLLDVRDSGRLPGPNAIAFLEHALAVLAGVPLSGPAKLETIGIFSGAVRLVVQAELDQRKAGQDSAQWQASLAGYLLRIASDGEHPHLAAAFADQPADGDPAALQPLFERAMSRIVSGLLPPSTAERTPARRVPAGRPSGSPVGPGRT